MTNEEISFKIREIDDKIAKAAATFILSAELRQLGKEREKFQALCTHTKENGELNIILENDGTKKCAFCGKELYD